MTLETTTTVSHLSFSAIDAAVHKRAAPLLKYATGAQVGRAPAGIVAPHTRAEWRALTPSARVAHITAGIKAQVIEAPAHRSRAAGAVTRGPRPDRPTAARTAAAPVESEIEAVPVDAVIPASGYLVACAGQCGTLISTNSARPVVRFCSPHIGQRRRSVSKFDEPGELTVTRYRARSVCRITGPKPASRA